MGGVVYTMFDTLLSCSAVTSEVGADHLAALERAFEGDLERLARANKVRVVLNPYYTRCTKWPTDLLKNIHSASYPLRRISVKPQMLSYWEVLALTVGRANSGLFGREGRAVRAFVMSDKAGLFRMALQLMAGDKGTELDMAVAYVDGQDGGPERVGGVDGSGRVSAPNMRAWANKLATRGGGGKLNIVIGARCEDIEAEISFSLLNLVVGGAAIIALFPPDTTTGETMDALVPIITVFAACFEETTLRHTLADDRVFLCGVRFIGPPESHKGIIALPEYDYAVATRLAAFIRRVHEWRLGEYKKILEINDELTKSMSTKLFAGRVVAYLESAYSNRGDEWVAMTGYLGHAS